MGGTGTGKSTFINTLTNYFRGGSIEDLKVAVATKYYKVTETGNSHILSFNTSKFKGQIYFWYLTKYPKRS